MQGLGLGLWVQGLRSRVKSGLESGFFRVLFMGAPYFLEDFKRCRSLENYPNVFGL